ncbi:MAG TPA: thioredoxin domain-containing protein, partial [Dyadobacter sp.]|nr:thioredoxin domain-containing protein [Dyadobacter sp.]
FVNHHDELAGSAEGFVQNMTLSESVKYGLTFEERQYSIDELDAMFEQIKKHFDTQKGGMDRAPKFPMPSIYKFLLRYFDITQNAEALAQIELSLTRIAVGGIYDHVGGGWTRYSVDEDWFIPHFEKMLYDNGQLLSIYAEAYSLTRNELYAERIRQTITWLQNEMRHEQGGFYSALDADSEGVEGKFYIWTYDELEATLGEDFSWFAALYNISEEGNWEHGYNHLHLTNEVSQTAKASGIYNDDFANKYNEAIARLATKRSEKIRPGLDDKILASWNGLVLKGLTDAYAALGDEQIRLLAVDCGRFLLREMTVDGKLKHSYKNGKATITAFLEDYAAVADGYIGLYQITFEEIWIEQARLLTDYTISNFYDEKEGYFYFTDSEGESLIARKKELFDNVIPASNSIMATNLYILGKILDKEDYAGISDRMLSQMHKILSVDVQWVTNWAALYCLRATPTPEIVIVGENADEIRKDLDRFFIPNKVILGTTGASSLPLLQEKTDRNGKALIYVCFDKTCQLPVSSVEEALVQIGG